MKEKLKTCIVCKQIKIYSEYYCNKLTGIPRGGKCKVCYNKHIKELVRCRKNNSNKERNNISRKLSLESIGLLIKDYQSRSELPSEIAKKYSISKDTLNAILKRSNIDLMSSMDASEIYTRKFYGTPEEIFERRLERDKAKKQKTKKKKKNRAREYILKLLRNSHCMDCDHSNWVTLQFDHRDPKIKKYDIARLVGHGASISLIEEEIAKCDIVCANCHSIRSQKMFGSWRINSDESIANTE